MSDTLLTETVTVTVQLAVLPLFVVAVIVAVPEAFAVTTPLLLTVATDVLLLVQVTVLLVVLEGETVAVKVSVLPTCNVVEVLFKDTLLTGTTTVTVQVALLPLFEVAIITAVPEAFAVTKPLLLTVATEVLLLAHVIVLFVAFDG